jgi:hypothetical protein
MYIRLAVEDMEPDHWIAWALDLPGCFSPATTETEAMARAPYRIAEYSHWLRNHDGTLPSIDEPIEVQVVETFHSFASSVDPDYLVNAFFENDRRPVAYWDAAIALRLLDWTRQDLLGVIQAAAPDLFTRGIVGKAQGTIGGILNHVAIAENWYFAQLGCGLSQQQLCPDPLDKLAMVRAGARERLLTLVGDERVTSNCDELWSARKVVRRALWHERDHTQHIARLLAEVRI